MPRMAAPLIAFVTLNYHLEYEGCGVIDRLPVFGASSLLQLAQHQLPDVLQIAEFQRSAFYHQLLGCRCIKKRMKYNQIQAKIGVLNKPKGRQL